MLKMIIDLKTNFLGEAEKKSGLQPCPSTAPAQPLAHLGPGLCWPAVVVFIIYQVEKEETVPALSLLFEQFCLVPGHSL